MDLILDQSNPPLDGKTHRHFPIDVRHNNKARRRTTSHLVRDSAKRLAKQGQGHLICQEHDGVLCHKPESAHADRLTRPHIEHDLRKVLALTHTWTGRHPSEAHDDGVHQGRGTRPWTRSRGRGLAEENSAQLARSDVPFPSDHNRNVRRPSLEREDAFCDANTFKPHGVRTQTSGDDAEVAELYRMGLLYDDGENANNFDLTSIRRDDPVYTIRPAKRARRSNGKQPGYEISRSLHLDLSFADLGDDDAIARYLNASSATTPAEIAAAHDEAIQHLASQRSNSGSPPLRVIYELDSLRPSFDVDTSQPPDLMDDSLSDYDCFSDSDLDDKSTQQREVREGGAGDAWVMLD